MARTDVVAGTEGTEGSARSSRLALVTLVSAVVVLTTSTIAAANHVFNDVPTSHTFHNDITWMADNGITRGCNPPANDRYCPDRSVTRGQMAAFMRRLSTDEVVRADTANRLGDVWYAQTSAQVGAEEPTSVVAWCQDGYTPIAGGGFQDGWGWVITDSAPWAEAGSNRVGWLVAFDPVGSDVADAQSTELFAIATCVPVDWGTSSVSGLDLPGDLRPKD